MKIVGWIAIIILVLSLVYFLIRRFVDRLNFNFSFKGVELSGFDWSELLSSGQTDLDVLLNINIRNDNGVAIPISNTKVWLYYNNTLVAETTGEVIKKSFVIPSKGQIDLTDNVKIYLNLASVMLIPKIISGKNPEVDYRVRLQAWGIPFTITNKFSFT